MKSIYEKPEMEIHEYKLSVNGILTTSQLEVDLDPEDYGNLPV